MSAAQPQPEYRGHAVDAAEAISDHHRVLAKLVDAIARHAHMCRLEAWWSVFYLADHVAGQLSIGEWRTLAEIARRQADYVEATTAPPGWKA